jgi:hypothetical protein
MQTRLLSPLANKYNKVYIFCCDVFLKFMDHLYKRYKYFDTIVKKSETSLTTKHESFLLCVMPLPSNMEN